jgi:hypothetical protein
VAFVRIEVSEERISSIIRVTGFGEFQNASVASYSVVIPSSPNLVTLTKEAIRSSETLVLTRPTRRHFPEDSIFHSHRRENLKSFRALTGWTL